MLRLMRRRSCRILSIIADKTLHPAPTNEQTRAPLPRAVLLLGWVSFFADVSSEMAYPLLPLFVVGVLGASATTLGGIEGGAALVVALVTAWAGFHSDRHRRRVPFVRVGYGLPVLGKTLMALAVVWPMVLAGRLIDRLGKGLRGSPRDALIADAAGPEMRGRAFGFHRAMDTAGAMAGVLLAAGILYWLTGTPHSEPGHAAVGAGVAEDTGRAFRIVLGLSAGLGVVSLVLTLLVRESAAKGDASPRAAAGSDDAPAKGLFGLPASYWRTIAPLLVFSLANSSDAFLLLRAREVGLSPWSVVLAYALYNLTYTVFSYPAGVVSDRFGRRRVIAIGWLVYAVVYAGFAYASSATVWPLLGLYGLYMAFTDGVGKALITDHAPAAKRGTALGVFYMSSGLLSLSASVIAGVLWDRVGASATFWMGSGTALIAVALIVVQKPARVIGE